MYDYPNLFSASFGFECPDIFNLSDCILNILFVTSGMSKVFKKWMHIASGAPLLVKWATLSAANGYFTYKCF